MTAYEYLHQLSGIDRRLRYDQMELEELLKEADDRLYQVKKTGKGNFTPLAKIPFPV